jgi:hypothetical protein
MPDRGHCVSRPLCMHWGRPCSGSCNNLWYFSGPVLTAVCPFLWAPAIQKLIPGHPAWQKDTVGPVLACTATACMAVPATHTIVTVLAILGFNCWLPCQLQLHGLITRQTRTCQTEPAQHMRPARTLHTARACGLLLHDMISHGRAILRLAEGS